MDWEGTQQVDTGFRSLFERSVAPMLLLDDSRQLFDANQAASLLLRLSRQEILDREIDQLLVPPPPRDPQQGWDEFIAAGTMSGRAEVVGSGPPPLAVQYTATANFRPGVHLSILTFPPDPDDRPAPPPGDAVALTDREREVMTLIAMGLDGPRVAEELSISAPTVQTHVRNAMGRLGAHTRAHAIALALTRGEIGL